MVICEPVEPDRSQLFEEAVAAAGLAMEITRLRVELRRQLAEVEASRARIMTASYEERKRIERDLHDGAQQRLVSIGLALRHAQHELDLSPLAARKALDGAVGQIAIAIDELRELARGIRPAQLDHGLAPALKELARRVPLPVKVKATRERFEPELEAAAYFIASEGLTNAVKHAQAERVTLSAQRMDGQLVICVADDGVGGAAASNGSGLRGLDDRVRAHGGRLDVRSEPDCGTTIVAELPCES